MAVLVLMTAATIGHAQFSASVQGTVTDSQGAVIPNVAVTLLNTGTGVELRATTNQTGVYRFTSVAPGNYSVIAKAQGFRSESVAVPVTPDETRGVDISLVPAAQSTNVNVTAVAPDLNPQETRVQTTLQSTEISELPLPNHDVQEMIALTPGVTGYQNESPSNGYGSSIFAGSFDPPYNANGQATNGNLYLIDDLPVGDDITQGNALMIPNSDMIDQLSLQTQTYSVENGTSASIQVAFATKSGSNAFHGATDYSYSGTNVGAAGDITNTFPAPSGTIIPTPVETFPEFHQDHILVSLGGPIVKDKTFFFGSMERQLGGIGATTSVGSVEWDPAFVAWAASAFPNSGYPKALTFAPNTRDYNRTVENAQTALGSSNCPTTNSTYSGQTTDGTPFSIPCSTAMYDSGMLFNQSQTFDGLQWNFRLDQSLRGGADRLYAMYERIDQKLGVLAERPVLDGITPSQNKYISLNWVHVLSSNLLNELHAGNLRSIQGSRLGNPAAAGIPYYPLGIDTTDGFAFMEPFGQEPFAAQTNWEHTYALRDTLSYTVRNHTIRGGYQFSREDYFQDSSGIYSRPFYPFYFTDTFSWISNTYQPGFNLYTIGGNGKFNPQYYGATVIYNGIWVDDSWRVRQNLTVTAGLRYDDFGNPVPYSHSGPFSPLYPGSGSTFYQQALNTTTHLSKQAFTGAQALNFQPRAGFSYTPFAKRDLVVHGGIGLYENALTPYQIANNLPTQPPERISLYTTSVLPFGDLTTTSAPYGYTYGPYPTYGTDPYGNIYSNATQTSVYSANLNGFAPSIKPEKFLLWSFGVEQQLPAHIVAGITYAGSHGYDLLAGASAGNGGGNVDFNLAPQSGTAASPTTRPSNDGLTTTEWGQLNYGVNALSSNYDAMIVTLKQHYKGLDYQANYNWSRALQWAPVYSDTDVGSIYVWQSAINPKSYYGPSNIDVTNSFSLGGGYEIPRFTGGNRLFNEALSGWRISSIIVAQTGTPFTVGHAGAGNDYANDGSLNLDGNAGTPQFPTYQSGLKHKGFSRKQVSLTGAFTPADFTNPAGLGTQPILSQQGANTFRNPGYFTVNSGFSKAFGVPLPRISEGGKLILRGEFINLLNRTNWQGIDNDLTDSDFGYSHNANQKRYVQIGGRFQF